MRKENIIWTLFVLDFDGTYDNEDEYDDGVQPLVYLIPLDKQIEVENCAKKAHLDFFEDTSDWCIGDHFENNLDENGIEFKLVGRIDLTFGERQKNYLADYIPREIV